MLKILYMHSGPGIKPGSPAFTTNNPRTGFIPQPCPLLMMRV